MIGLFPGMSMFVFRKQLKLVIDSSMATTMLFGLFIAVLCAGHTISREMKNGTVLLLMSKPVTRSAFVLSKIFGIWGALTIFVTLCVCASAMSVLIAKDQFQLDNIVMGCYFGALGVRAIYGGVRNYMAQKSFSSHAVAAMLVLLPILTVVMYVVRYRAIVAQGYDDYIPLLQLIPALLLMFPAVWVMGLISAALAIRLDFISNLLICLAIFLVGLVSQYFLIQWFCADSTIGAVLGSILPNWQFFWMADALTNQAQIPAAYVVWAVIYVILHGIGWTLWAMYLFQDNELARDSR
jgi:ABC-type transport system involved in multi-copper enzyme maturation permease subunit